MFWRRPFWLKKLKVKDIEKIIHQIRFEKISKREILFMIVFENKDAITLTLDPATNEIVGFNGYGKYLPLLKKIVKYLRKEFEFFS